MAYTKDEIKYLLGEWWKTVPFKDKARGMIPIIISMGTIFVNKALPMLALTAIKAARLAGMNGLSALSLGFWWANFQLAFGWVIGWSLAEIDHVFYAITCDSKEETCQRVKREIDLKRWKSAWKILQATVSEREQMPVRNVVTLLTLGVMGIWIATSSASLSALGLIFGLGTRLIMELWQTKKYKSWYWMFKRDFEWVEHRAILLILTGIVVYQGIGILRV